MRRARPRWRLRAGLRRRAGARRGAARARRPSRRGARVRVEFCGLTLAHPIINGSRTLDAIAASRAFGASLRARFPFAAYVSKTITLQPRLGNPPPPLWETPAGLINSIGLPNKGLQGYLREDLPALAELCAAGAPDGGGGQRGAIPLITNVMGAGVQEITALIEACDERAEIDALELNVSCPNVKTGLDIGADPVALGEVLRAVRPSTRKPLIVKLTPNTADVALCARAAQEAGADAVSLINTLRASALAPARAPGAGEPWLGGRTGGRAGPAGRGGAAPHGAGGPGPG